MSLLEPNQWHELENGNVFWAPHFFDEQQSQQLFDALYHQIEWQSDEITIFGKTMPIPRLQAWYGDKAYRYSNLLMQPKPWLTILQTLRQRCEQAAHTEFNSVLCNLYRDGNDSNGWHSDNEPELGAQPVIASISFGETRKFHLKHRVTKQKHTFELTSGSLLIMAGDTQKYWQHTVPKTKLKKSPRINLTFRNIVN
ncbi:alpha-ketoglutarate-dependent dioxygenase AlkB [Vibrio sp. T187]|uniref:alpha-ketoglutarate-dependent dioxygenase AlkB family protein n=1 Tax=Vibrio TaxID=662 RepID=UPI0010C93B43|nr:MULTISPECIES: alpha-ketoglutarate-dependent dioxygenase AlkB [Vibrio]MBW3695296.1 alpha-ketoglutarate-dependent dioxygenase AlkB [Vibrio sp. T187]